MDAASGKIVAVETIGPFARTTVRTWTLDVCTNTWQMMRPPREPALGVGPLLVYDADSDLIVAIASDQPVWTYSVTDNRWTPRPWAGGPLRPLLAQVTYDLSSGNVIARELENGYLWSYRVEARLWMRFDRPGPVNSEGSAGDLMTYDRAQRRVVLVLATYPYPTWTFQPTSGVWSEQAASPQLNFGRADFGARIAYDQSAQRTVIFSYGFLATYDATRDRWATVPLPRSLFNPLTAAGPLARAGHTMVFDPVNKRLVILGGWVNGTDADDVWAYKVASNTWTQLVP